MVHTGVGVVFGEQSKPRPRVEPRAMGSGSTLVAGSVTLRFYQPFDFVARVDSDIGRGRI